MRGRVALVLVLSLPALRPAAAQLAPTIRYQAGWGDVAASAAGGALYFVPSAIGLPHGLPSCGPCDPATVPAVDRWVIHAVSRPADLASSAILFGVAAGTAVAGLRGLSGADLRGNFATFADAASWTAASMEWVKVLVHRNRPVLYTSGAAAALADKDNEQSFPSGHTALAFAAATSYLVMAAREHLPHRTRNAALLYAGAAGVGILRIAAGKHFPTDVLAGAALGSGIGWLVPTIHPTR